MSDEVFTGSLDELRDALIELERVTIIAGLQRGLSHPDLFSGAGVPAGWKPGTLLFREDARVALGNFDKIVGQWRRLLSSTLMSGIEGVPDLAALRAQIREHGNARYSGDLGYGDHGDLYSALATFIDESGLEISRLITSVEIAAAGRLAGHDSAAPTAPTADQTRWEFARPLREKGLKWKTIAEQWRKETGDPADDEAFEVSCGRAKRKVTKGNGR